MTTKGPRPRGIAGMVWDLNNPHARLHERVAANPRLAQLIVVMSRDDKQREFRERVLRERKFRE